MSTALNHSTSFSTAHREPASRSRDARSARHHAAPRATPTRAASRFAEAHVAAAGLRYRAHLPGDLTLYELPSDTRRHLYLAVKEAVNNAVKHADATEIGLHISVESHELCLHITDNGRGIPSHGGDPTGNGLTSMRERLAAVHGTVQFNPVPGGGTRVVFTVPVTPKTT